MADLLTVVELEALRDFYVSDTGQLVMMKRPASLTTHRPQIMAMVQTTMPMIMPRLQAVVAGH